MSRELADMSMVELFAMELGAHHQALENGLVGLEDAVTPERVEPLMRAAHSIKGAARIVGLTQAVGLAHAMEDVLLAVQKSGCLPAPHADALLAANDFFGGLARLSPAELPAALDAGAAQADALEHALRQLGPPLAQPPGDLPAAGPSSLPAAAQADASTGVAATAPASAPRADLTGGQMDAPNGGLAGGQTGAPGDPAPGHPASQARPSQPRQPAPPAPQAAPGHCPAPPGQASPLIGPQPGGPGEDLAAPSQTRPNQARLEPAQAGPAQTGSDQAGPKPAGPEQTGSAQAGSDQAGPKLAGPGQASSEPESAEASEVRLSAEVLGRLMGLAGQCLVETGGLPPLLAALRRQRLEIMELSGLITELRAGLGQSEAGLLAQQALATAKSLAARQAEVSGALDGFTRRMEVFSHKLYQQVLKSRMRPFGEGVRAFPRMVRDLGRELGKQVRMVVDGRHTGVDRDILEQLEAPLIHLVRNAVDHGVEPPEARLAAGKPPQARVTLSARHAGGMLEVRVADDGQGIDPVGLAAAVVRRGLADEAMTGRMSTAELYDFLFLPGFSTAAAVTGVSGRGVGLDVVKTMVQRVGGQLRVESAAQAGTAFVLRLPVTLSVVRALVVLIGREPYALPLSRVDRVALVPREDMHSAGGRQYARVEGASVGIVDAAQLLGLEAELAAGPDAPLVLLSGEGGSYALAVDALVGERDLVVKPLDARLGKVPNVLACALLEDGAPVLILDAEDLTRSVETLLTTGRLARVGQAKAQAAASGAKRVLVVDDSLTVREVERQLLSGRGYQVVTAVDGMEGLGAARSGEFALVVTDVDMPRMTGIELTRRLKADPALAATPVMIVSYKDREEDRLAGLEAGADYYLAKSGFRDETLLAAVFDLIGDP